MPTVVGVKLRNAAKPLYFDPNGLELAPGQTVIVSTERGSEVGEIAHGAREVDKSELQAEIKPVVRVATDDDLRRAEELREREAEAMASYRRLVVKHKLDMKPIDVEFLFDGDKMVFYFVAEERVDFRDLVRDLAAEFKVRVDMRQVGVRDEARLIGGLGHCGETLCCVRFGGEFQPVSIRMAKEQDLPLNPQKISGLCGRLMCCLRYEYEAYKDFKGRAPKRNAIIETPKGLGKVVELNTPREMVTMRLEDGERLTVPLSGMDCDKEGGCQCPWKVRADALPEEADPLAAIAAAAPPALASETAAKAETAEAPKSRRRRRGGGGGASASAGAEKPAGGEESSAAAAPKSGRRSRRGGGGGQAAAKGEQKAAQPKAAQPKQPADPKPVEGASAEGGEGAKTARRRRRRRRPGAKGGEE